MHAEVKYHIQDLVDASDISRRTIHYYISIGLLPHAKGSGRNGHYTQVHMDRLLRIRELKDQFMLLKDIREVLDKEESYRNVLSVQEEGASYDAQRYPLSITVTIQKGIQVMVPMDLYMNHKTQVLQALQELEQSVMQIKEE